jgi:hypothetical protein
MLFYVANFSTSYLYGVSQDIETKEKKKLTVICAPEKAAIEYVSVAAPDPRQLAGSVSASGILDAGSESGESGS